MSLIGAGENDADKQRQLDRVLLVPTHELTKGGICPKHESLPCSTQQTAISGWWIPLEMVPCQLLGPIGWQRFMGRKLL